MKVRQLSITDHRAYNANFCVTVTYEDIAALGANASATLQLFPKTGTLPPGTCVRNVKLVLVTAFDFSDAGITSMLIEVGDGGDTDRFLASTQVAIDGTEVLYKGPSISTAPYTYDAADGVDLLVTVANGGSPLLNECTSGVLEIYLQVDDWRYMRRGGGVNVAV